MMRKIFGIKSISHLIYGLLMLAPILAIGVKCGYVMLNKNANQSYTNGEVIGKNEIANPSLLVENQDYIFNYKEYITSNYDYLPYLAYNSISIDWQDYTSTDTTGVISFRMRTNDNLIQLKKIDNSVINLFNVWGQTLNTFTINYKSAEFTQTAPFYNMSVIGLIYQQNKLDNVFYYAIDEIIQDNNFGKINFTGWFDNMMLDNNIQINQTYTHLFNWYLNYTLFISCAYILWLVLMWFVTFARKLLDRGMNYDW